MKILNEFAQSIVNFILDSYESLKTSRDIGVLTVLGGAGTVLAACALIFIGSAVIQDSNQPTNLLDGTASFVDRFGELHVLDIEVADTEQLRREGLMFRTYLPPNQGMLFTFPSSEPRTFWMKNTLISLDIIFLDSSGTVVSFAENTKTQQTTEVYSSASPAMYVLEANSGWVMRTNLSVGDQFQLDY